MSHFKLSSKELELFVLSMKIHLRKINEDHPQSYVFKHPVSKQKKIFRTNHRQNRERNKS